MIKKLAWLALICILLVGAGWLFYVRRAPRTYHDTIVASHWPGTGTDATPNSANAPGSHAAAPHASDDAPNKKEASAVEPVFALRQGETLEFAANLPKLNSTVANLKIVALEKKNSGGKGAWHLQAFAHTESPYRMVFELDDQFDSYSDAASMASVQYEMHLSERGQKVDSVQRMLPSLRDPAPPDASAARVLPGTRDPLGMLEYLRGVDWTRTSQVRSPVYDGHKLYDVRAVLVGKSAAVTVPMGHFNAMKIEIHVLDDGTEMKDAHFLLYLTNDAERLPVLLEAVLPVATARVELTKAK
jgi:hypothetical protein